MRQIKIIAVGKIKEKFIKEALVEYQKRLSRFCKLEVIEVKDFPDDLDPLKREAKLILPKIKGTAFPLCIEGTQLSSIELSELIDKENTITFIIGGSNGLDNSIKQKGKPISFSKMTFPHQLMRLILIEQIYRSFKILGNESYHK